MSTTFTVNTSKPGGHYRVDADHTLMSLMERAIDRLTRTEVRIHLSESEVVLHGNTTTWSDKQLIQESIRSLSGSRRIRNEVRVEYQQ